MLMGSDRTSWKSLVRRPPQSRHSFLPTSTYKAAHTSSHLSYKCTFKNNHVELPQLVCLLAWDLFLDLSCPAFVQPPRPTASAVPATAPEGTANVKGTVQCEWQPAIRYQHSFPGAPTPSDPPEHMYDLRL